MEQLKTIEEYYQLNKLDEALDLINREIESAGKSEQLFLWLGKVYYKKQEWGKAINAFNKVLDINPDNQDAKSNIEMANAILGYFTPDMFNP